MEISIIILCWVTFELLFISLLTTMKKVVQISIEVNSGSVGKIAEQIGQKAIDSGWESYITYARNNLPSKSRLIRVC